jgi:hypothetical protein
MMILIFTLSVLSGCGGSSGDVSDHPQVTPYVQNGVEVVYFHRAQRCAGCIHAQDMTEYTLNTYFAEELQSGDIVFVALNLQDAANAAMVQKYGAYTSSLFINDVEEGIEQIEQIIDIWFVLWDDEEFVELVKTEIEEHLAD